MKLSSICLSMYRAALKRRPLAAEALAGHNEAGGQLQLTRVWFARAADRTLRF